MTETTETTRDRVHPDAGRWGGWAWHEPARGEHFRRCSFCGSVHPDDLAAEPVWRARWADRKYGWPHKFYVDIPNRVPDALFAVGSTNAGQAPGSGWVAVADLSDEHRAIIARDRMASESTTYYLFGPRPSHFGKFYTIHLADLTLGEETRESIQRRSGLSFTFHDDGSVRWGPAR